MSRNRLPLILITAGIISGAGGVVGNIVANDVEGYFQRYRGLSFIVFILCLILGIALAIKQARWEQGHGVDGTSDDMHRRNRERMLSKVRSFWIQGVLENSLHHAVLIELGLEERPEAVMHSWNLILHRDAFRDQRLPPGTPIIQVFDRMAGELLIQGAPGAGKTTLLLQLARDLLKRADADPNHEIPVVFNLSSWGERREPLATWLADELILRYEVPRTLAEVWTRSERILPLLDGLDEVREEHRAACVDAINAFRRENGLLRLVICSRSNEYEVLPRQLSLRGAVRVLPLTMVQIEAAFAAAGPSALPLREAVARDAVLQELADTPLILGIMLLVYRNPPAQELAKTESLAQARHRLFREYERRMVTRRGAEPLYTAEQTSRWLAWLARMMLRSNQTVFRLEQMQLGWLRTQRQERLLSTWLAHAAGLVVGVGAALVLIAEGQRTAGVVLGLLLWISLVAVLEAQELVPVETLKWSWSHARTVFGPGFPTFVLGIGFVGAMIALCASLVAGFYAGIVAFLAICLASIPVGVLDEGFRFGTIELKSAPHEAIRRSGRMALVFGSVAGLLSGSIAGSIWLALGLRDALFFGAGVGGFMGVMLGLNNGGSFWLQHHCLRALLCWDDLIPLRYVRFLDYAVDRILLRKVGGGYIFMHRLLMEYYAENGLIVGETEIPENAAS